MRCNNNSFIDLQWSLEINKTVIVASRLFLFHLTYIDDARSNTNQVCTGNCLFLLLYLGCTNNQSSIPFGDIFCLLPQSHQGPFLCCLEFSYLKIDGVGDEGSGITTDSLRGLFWHFPEIRLFHRWIFFSGKNAKFLVLGYSPGVLDYQVLWDVSLTELCCTPSPIK